MRKRSLVFFFIRRFFPFLVAVGNVWQKRGTRDLYIEERAAAGEVEIRPGRERDRVVALVDVLVTVTGAS